MKKLLGLITVLILVLVGCGSTDEKHIEDLKVTFVPSAPADEILTATAPLEAMLKEEFTKSGYTVDKVTVDVGTSYEAVGQGLASGTIDVGLIPGGTYVLYEEDNVSPALTATRFGLNKDFPTAKEWNDGKETLNTEEQVTYYRSLIVAGPSKKGQELAAKVNKGEALTFEDINSANVCVQSPSSSSGYLYPSLLMQTAFDKSITDLETVVQLSGYGDAMSRLATEQCDIAPIFADARQVFAENWEKDYGRSKSIWEETNVIGVTDGIMNDTVSVAGNSEIVTEEFTKALQDAFINIAKTEEGQKIISIYSHEGYLVGNPSDYDAEREVQKQIIGK